MINSSCDQPIGYPIYVSPLTTSYSSTHSQYSSIVGSELSLRGVIKAVRNLWQRVSMRCGDHCYSGGSASMDCPPPNTPQSRAAANQSSLSASQLATGESRSRHDSFQNSPRNTLAPVHKPNNAFVSFAGLLNDPIKENLTHVNQRVQVGNIVYCTLYTGGALGSFVTGAVVYKRAFSNAQA